MTENNKSKSLKIIDLFCGAGGFSEGFRQAGYQILTGIDNDPEAIETYNKNFPEAKSLLYDLSQTDSVLDSFLDRVKTDDQTAIIGGPPCQGFSVAGKRDLNDPRNALYRAYIHLIKIIKPRVIVLENVPTILGLYNGSGAKAITEDFEKLGYKTVHKILHARDYGVPQNRKRVFFVGVKNGRAFSDPKPITFLDPITTEMAISDLPLLEDNLGSDILEYINGPNNNYQSQMRQGSNFIYNHWAVDHKKRTREIISLVPDGGNYKNLPKHLQSTRKVNIAWTRMNSKKPCFTIDAGHNHHFHYKANRVPTVRECARIQSFPDRFRFYGKKTSQFRLVGNAVPPLLAKAIALKLKDMLK